MPGEHESQDGHPFRDALRNLWRRDDQPPVLHGDDRYATAVNDGGEVVRNLTAEEYAASYDEGEPHRLPDEVLAQLPREDGDG